MTVVEAAPLPGVDLPIEKIPAPVQTVTSEEIEGSKALDLSSFLTRRFNAVFANEITKVFDRRYYTAGQLGPFGFTETGSFVARPLPAINGEYPLRQATFYAPGAPARTWIGTRFRF